MQQLLLLRGCLRQLKSNWSIGSDSISALSQFEEMTRKKILRQEFYRFIPCMSIKKQANEIRPGNIIQTPDGKLMQVLKFQHSQGAARQLGNVNLELRDVLTSSKHPLRIRTSDVVEVVRLDEKKFQYLYAEGDALLHMMNPDTFEQITVDRSIFGEASKFLLEGSEVTLEFHEGTPISGSLPPQVPLTVTMAAPSMKGEAVTLQFKKATVETGADVQVPPFVVTGDTILVDTTTGEFVKRV